MIVLTIVSVPCGVFVFLNYLLSECINDALNGFRPLRGLRISQSVADVLNYWEDRFGFRPLRGLRISQFYWDQQYRDSRLVSVPCGVFVFLNTQYLRTSSTLSKSFRPLRGLRISQCARRRRQLDITPFPSPAGSSYFSMTVCTSPDASVFASFRPLRGLRISQSISNVLNVIMEPEVSVPCGVFVFLNAHHGI